LIKEGGNLATPNYQYEKRQRDLAKKKKKEEKRLAALEKKKSIQVWDTEGTPSVSGLDWPTGFLPSLRINHGSATVPIGPALTDITRVHGRQACNTKKILSVSKPLNRRWYARAN
jgi:hypothetical protein